MGLLVYVCPMVYVGLAAHHNMSCPTDLGFRTSDVGLFSKQPRGGRARPPSAEENPMPIKWEFDVQESRPNIPPLFGLFRLAVHATHLKGIDHGHNQRKKEPLDSISQMRAFVENDFGRIAVREFGVVFGGG